MIGISIKLDGDNAWPDLQTKPHINAMGGDTRIEVAALAAGMESGRPAVAFRVEAPSGEIMIFETSLRLLKSTVDAIVARYGDPT